MKTEQQRRPAGFDSRVSVVEFCGAMRVFADALRANPLGAMWPIKKSAKLKDLVPGTSECVRLCATLWPTEWDSAKHLGAGSPFRHWLNEKTGLNIAGDAPASFNHWLPRLREMLAERGLHAD